MQTNAINSINFGRKIAFIDKKTTQEERQQRNIERANQYRQKIEALNIGAGDDENLSLEEKLDIIDNVVAKANSNVHPSTVICSVAGMIAAGLATTKITKAGRKFVVTVGEGIGKSAVDIFSKAKKSAKKVDIEAAKNKIAAQANALREGNPDSKLISGLHDFTAKVIGEDKAKVVTEKLQKAGVTNGVTAFDAAAGIVAAATVVDPASDAIEQHIDKKDILETVNALL